MVRMDTGCHRGENGCVVACIMVLVAGNGCHHVEFIFYRMQNGCRLVENGCHRMGKGFGGVGNGCRSMEKRSPPQGKNGCCQSHGKRLSPHGKRLLSHGNWLFVTPKMVVDASTMAVIICKMVAVPGSLLSRRRRSVRAAPS